MSHPETLLVRRAAAGDEEAFRLIVERYQDRVFAVSRGILGNSEDAEDTTQQAFAKAYFSLGRFDFRSSLFTWIYKIAVNECFGVLRKRKVRRAVGQAVSIEGDLHPADRNAALRSPDDFARRTEVREILLKLLARLSEEERYLLIMKELEGYTSTELAGITPINKNTVKVKLLRARLKLVKAARQAGVLSC
jgi:RNA polymerase sigma-70 factor (ECF subfamily)